MERRNKNRGRRRLVLGLTEKEEKVGAGNLHIQEKVMVSPKSKVNPRS